MERPEQLIERSRRLRKDATWPEKILWSNLRAGRLGGLKFRRQHPVLGHITDLACTPAKVAIEVDGASHDGTREQADDRKEQVLTENGWLVLRFSNRDINTNLSHVLDHILDVCQKRIEERKGLS